MDQRDVTLYLIQAGPGRTQSQLAEAIFGGEAKASAVGDDCRTLVNLGLVECQGTGLVGDPYRYFTKANVVSNRHALAFWGLIAFAAFVGGSVVLFGVASPVRSPKPVTLTKSVTPSEADDPHKTDPILSGPQSNPLQPVAPSRPPKSSFTDSDTDRVTTYATILGGAIAGGYDTKPQMARIGRWIDNSFDGSRRGTLTEVLVRGLEYSASMQKAGRSPDICSAVGATLRNLTLP